MKKLLLLLFVVLLGYQQAYSQDSKKLEIFRAMVFPQYSSYFNKVELTDNGQLNLNAENKYIVLLPEGKKAIMINITKASIDSMVLVSYGSKRELWGWSNEAKNIVLLDEWDLNSIQSVKLPEITPNKTNLHPWFFYVGGQLGGDSQQNINLMISSRIGFFLLLHRWDFAATMAAGLTGHKDADGTGWYNLGLMSRVHFPIKKYGISPNLGGELTLASYGGTSSKPQASLVLGISWFVGFGSLDVGIKIGKNTTGIGGYTIYPGIRSNK